MTCKIKLTILEQEVADDETPYLDGFTTVGQGRHETLAVKMKFPVKIECLGFCEPYHKCEPSEATETTMDVTIPVGPEAGIPDPDGNLTDWDAKTWKCMKILDKCTTDGRIPDEDTNACWTKRMESKNCTEFNKAYQSVDVTAGVQAELDALGERLQADPDYGGTCKCVRYAYPELPEWTPLPINDDPDALDFLKWAVERFGDSLTEHLMRSYLGD
tara:strand:+ start:1316 stop:1963 length:648 start_codon:yes stop_codon:yes gene_type:complete